MLAHNTHGKRTPSQSLQCLCAKNWSVHLDMSLKPHHLTANLNLFFFRFFRVRAWHDSIRWNLWRNLWRLLSRAATIVRSIVLFLHSSFASLATCSKTSILSFWILTASTLLPTSASTDAISPFISVISKSVHDSTACLKVDHKWTESCMCAPKQALNLLLTPRSDQNPNARRLKWPKPECTLIEMPSETNKIEWCDESYIVLWINHRTVNSIIICIQHWTH